MKNQACYFCGCDTFRFNSPENDNPFLDNTCGNCQHRLRDHLKTTTKRQNE